MVINKLSGSWPIPSGTRDVLPGEAKKRRVLENKIVEIFEKQGYQEVATPTVEFFDTLAFDLGEEVGNDLYRLFDRDGRLLVLRPDMTTPIARLVSTRMRDFPLPLRLFYLANVFRYESPQAGRLREFCQAGVELIGIDGPKADAEIIALAVETLYLTGLKGFQINLGETRVINGIIEETNLLEDEVRFLKALMAKKDLVGLEEFMEQKQIVPEKKEMVLKISNLHGGLEVLGETRRWTSNAKVLQAIDYLEQVWSYLVNKQVDNFVKIDLGIFRSFEYYTGMVFEGYVNGLGFPLCGGGRYDNLLAKFDYPCPATGFALGLERLILALDKQSS